jgi:nanoRNase/pAp phosphatase (c-di-AMP/oligoRNAs hydrolase)
MRLITRSDFDGLACAALLEEIGVINDYLFVHPKDVQDGKVPATKDDVLANVPFVPGCGLWFDHHLSEVERLRTVKEHAFVGASKPAPSCARVIYEYYGGAAKFKRFDEGGLMQAIDKSDSGNLTLEDVALPTGWMLLSFIMDARTGLGRFKDFRISNYDLMKDLIGYIRTLPVDQILANPDVQARVDRYFAQETDYRAMIQAHSRLDGTVLAIDLRNVPEILSGNRFAEYALFPQANVSIRAIWGREKKNVVFTVGHSILNRTCKVNVGSLMLQYGGGGHPQVGTCQIDTPLADKAFAKLIAALQG